MEVCRKKHEMRNAERKAGEKSIERNFLYKRSEYQKIEDVRNALKI